jgi:exosortase B
MNTTLEHSTPGKSLLMTWWPVLLGLAVLFIPTYLDLAAGPWETEEQAHGPIVLIVTLYLIWSKRAELFALISGGGEPRPASGGIVFVFGLLLYAVGRSQDIIMFEVGAQIFILLGVLLITVGWGAVKLLWFPLFFLLFMLPLPGFVVDAATGPLKQHVSEMAEAILYAVGYPIARNGVVLHVGQYQLLVADACSGMHSMFSLSAMGLLYLYLMQHKSWWRNGILIASILPIAFFANMVRVMVLVLVTYHFGDEAAQGVVHDSAGILLFVIGLLTLFLLDGLLGFVFRDEKRLPAR